MVGIAVSASVLAVRGIDGAQVAPYWTVLPLFLGLLAVGASTLSALLAYEVTTLGIGMRAADLRDVVQGDLTASDFAHRLVLTYADTLEGNRASIDRSALRFKAALWILLAGLVLLGATAGGFMYG